VGKIGGIGVTEKSGYQRPEPCEGCIWYPCDQRANPPKDCLRKEVKRQGRKTYDLNSDNPNAPTAIDLFCGCGGASLGFVQAGFNVLCGIDLGRDALETYQFNIGNAVMADVRFLPLREGIAPKLLHYSPPCQGFSTANTTKKGKDGKLKPKYRVMNRLMLYAALAVEYLQPEFISMEEVPLTAKSKEFLEMCFFLRYESTTVYDLQWKILDAADYGVPQHRVRLWLIGRKMKIEGVMSLPADMSIAQLNMLTLPDTTMSKDPLQSQLFEFAPEVGA
jgi:DNA (cytosine-5)-methyltransferase 1